MQDMNDFEHYDTTMGGTQRRTVPPRRPAGRSWLIPPELTAEHKEAAVRMCYCPDHWHMGNGTEFSCPVCVRQDIDKRHPEAITREIPIHLIPADQSGPVCGGTWVRGHIDHKEVTCPDCLIVDYMRTEGLIGAEPEPPAESIRIHGGPHWEHDCDRCIFLGSRPGSGREWDLYWCPPNPLMSKGNVIARHGIMGDYVSGMEWIDREPMLAVAAILAMRTGHLSPSAIV